MDKWEREYAKMLQNMEAVTEKVGPKSMTMAINRMSSRARGIAARAVAKEKAIPLFMVNRRIWARNANLKKLYSSNRAYVSDMSMINLMDNARGGFVKGKRPHRQPGDVGPGYGGITIRGHFMPDAFVNKIRRNQVLHVMRRKQRATWTKGKDGSAKRLPVEVLKMHLQSSFDRYFARAFVVVVRADYNKEFNSAFKKNLITILKK
jgi:hypothetical protein